MSPIVRKQIKQIVDIIANQVYGEYSIRPSNKEQLDLLINHYSTDLLGIDNLDSELPQVYDMIFDTLSQQFDI